MRVRGARGRAEEPPAGVPELPGGPLGPLTERHRGSSTEGVCCTPDLVTLCRPWASECGGVRLTCDPWSPVRQPPAGLAGGQWELGVQTRAGGGQEMLKRDLTAHPYCSEIVTQLLRIFYLCQTCMNAPGILTTAATRRHPRCSWMSGTRSLTQRPGQDTGKALWMRSGPECTCCSCSRQVARWWPVVFTGGGNTPGQGEEGMRGARARGAPGSQGDIERGGLLWRWRGSCPLGRAQELHSGVVSWRQTENPRTQITAQQAVSEVAAVTGCRPDPRDQSPLTCPEDRRACEAGVRTSWDLLGEGHTEQTTLPAASWAASPSPRAVGLFRVQHRECSAPRPAAPHVSFSECW